ncbi:MAG: GNAT family N-acetyltransferase [Acidobacteria bacterium]|nr:MAG: GNAT family N-acetyltransferase [Acidobacteriota bacterium]
MSRPAAAYPPIPRRESPPGPAPAAALRHPAASGPRRMRVERVPLPALGEAWRELEARARTRNIFVSWQFQRTWWEHFHHGKQGRVYLVRGPDGRPVAIVPLYVERRRYRFGTARVLSNVGAGAVVNPDFLDALVEPDREEEVARALAPHVLADPTWDFADLNELPPDGSLPRIARVWARRYGIFFSAERRATCPYVPLPGSFETYLAMRPAKFRHRVRRCRRRIERDLGVRWREVGPDLEPAHGAAILKDLHQRRMESRGRSGNFSRRAYFDFHRDLIERLADSGGLALFILMSGGRPIATHYGFLHDGVYFGYQMGFAPRYHRYSPGFYMTGVIMEKLIERGYREMNLLRGTDAWKFRWTDRTRHTIRVTLLRPGWRSSLARLRAALSAPPALVLRFLIGRDAFDELRRAWRRLADAR